MLLSVGQLRQMAEITQYLEEEQTIDIARVVELATPDDDIKLSLLTGTKATVGAIYRVGTSDWSRL